MAIYYVYSGAGGSNNGSSWANAFTTLTTAFVTEAAGDTLYVAHDHSETAGGQTLTSSGVIANPTKVICVNRSGSVPPVSADRRATAAITSNTTGAVSLGGCTHYDGIIFTAGATTTTTNLIYNATADGFMRFDNCSLRLGGTGTGSRITTSQGSGYVELNNTTMSFAAVGQGVVIAGVLRWRNTASALLGTIPTALFNTSTTGAYLELIGVDLSAAGSGKTIVPALTAGQAARYRFIDCKLNASVTKSTVPNSPGSNDVDFIRSGSSGVNYTIYSHRALGLLIEETTIVRTGGATDGTTPISWKVVTTASANYTSPYECPPIAIWNDTTGSARTATIECIASAIMTDQECWVELEYLGDASSPQGSFASDAKADLLATAANQTTSSATWGGSTAAFKLNVTFTAQQRGWVYARVKVGKASTTVYIDPLVTLS